MTKELNRRVRNDVSFTRLTGKPDKYGLYINVFNSKSASWVSYHVTTHDVETDVNSVMDPVREEAMLQYLLTALSDHPDQLKDYDSVQLRFLERSGTSYGRPWMTIFPPKPTIEINGRIWSPL